MPDLKEILTESYRKAVTDYFDKNKMAPDKDISKLSHAQQEEAIYQMIVRYTSEKIGMIEKWSSTPLDELQGSTPAQVIEGLSELNEVFDVFTHMACFADEELPILLVYKLQQFGSEAITRLYRLALESREGQPPSDYLFSAAISALGVMQSGECVTRLIELADQITKEPQLEQLEDALKRHRERVVEPLLERLQDAKWNATELMLLYALAYGAAEAKDDRVYLMLRSVFRTLQDKTTPILCFGVYGDGRAVPMLRSYLEKNAHSIPDRLFHEIIGAIRNLGGETEALEHNHHHHHHE
ncbi:MAG: hypothetical protein KBA53_07220 [Thermoclostridium sp.]|nr:hypothetical protein [Thermoclostridium sp.]